MNTLREAGGNDNRHFELKLGTSFESWRVREENEKIENEEIAKKSE